MLGRLPSERSIMRFLIHLFLNLAGPWGFSASGWAAAALFFLLLRALFGGTAEEVFVGTGVATLITGLAARVLVRSFAHAEAHGELPRQPSPGERSPGEEDGGPEREGDRAGERAGSSYVRAQAACLLPRLAPLVLPLALLAFFDHPLWWFLPGLPLGLLLLGSSTVVLSPRGWGLLVFLPLVLAVVAFGLWLLWKFLDRLLPADLSPYGWLIPVLTLILGALAAGQLGRNGD